MCIMERFFYLEQEPCVIHLPEKPNGFGIFILGDYHSFVDSSTSLWMQHSGRSQLLENLRERGYTLFSSNLYGRHWGAEKAVRLAQRLYHIVLKKEILNQKIHIIAEGMGALVALQLMHRMPDEIRSAALFQPCLDLRMHLELEKEHKFFYKRLVKELQLAYGTTEEHVLAAPLQVETPMKILVPIHEKKERKQWYREFEQKGLQAGNEISLSFHLQESKYKTAESLAQFFRQYEQL